MMPAVALKVCQPYHGECEAVVNGHAALELHKSLQCLARACCLYHHHNVALKQIVHFFLLRSHEQSKRAKSLMYLLNRRGSRISFLSIRMPETPEQESSLQAMKDTLHLEKSVSQSLLNLHQLATKSSDAHLCLETCHLDQQLEFVEELGDHLTSVRKMRSPEGGLVEYVFDKLTLGNGDKED
ncbi:ferritin heavy chain-like [Moschus berezovskii]|uniref:ferritin heavy chain-like n=1 Tax=Moschus berezovskii TaxID=68408 RepID=UPI002444A6E8|nr:ferritin heavy chain-like [Moschus berezovskii]